VARGSSPRTLKAHEGLRKLPRKLHWGKLSGRAKAGPQWPKGAGAGLGGGAAAAAAGLAGR
jgi:hypothetical protein